MSDISAGSNMHVAWSSSPFFAQDNKLLLQNLITVHNLHPSNTCSIHVSYSLFPTPGTRETSAYFSEHNICNQMQYSDYILFNIQVRTDFCLCGLV